MKILSYDAISLPVSILWDHWPGLRHGPSCTRWLGALTWPSWPMCGPWARFSRPGVCLKPPEMKPCVRWWPYRPGNLSSKRNPRRIHFFPNVLCGRSCNLSSTRQDSLERITGSSLRFHQWEATGNRAVRPVTFPRLLHKLLGVNTDTHNSCHLPMLMSSVTRTALGFQVYAEMGVVISVTSAAILGTRRRSWCVTSNKLAPTSYEGSRHQQFWQ